MAEFSNNMTSTLGFAVLDVTNPSVNLSSTLFCPPRAVSQKTRYILDVICYTGLTTLMCCIGIPTNIVSCVVFWRQGLQDRMNLCLFALAMTDCLYLVSIFLVVAVSSFIRFSDEALRAEYYSKTISALGGVVYGFKSISGCINMVIAVERCVCVVSPHRASSVMRTRSMAAVLLSCLVFFQAAFLIYPLSYHAVMIETSPGRMVWTVYSTRFQEENKIFVYVFENTLLETVVPIVTFVVVSGSTAVTVRKLTASIRWREKTSSASSEQLGRQTALTAMLVVVSCVYVITMVPFVARKMSFWFLGEFLVEPSCLELFMAASAVVFAISVISTSFNFFVYCSRSSRYRAELRGILSRVAGN